MATTLPSIVCLGVIGRNNNPLHVSIFPSYDPSTNSLAPIRTPLQFSLLLSSTLDVFELRARGSGGVGVGGGGSATGAAATTAAQLSGDLGLLHAVDDRLAAYGAETNTGVKFVAVVDMRGRLPGGGLLSPSSSGPAVDKDRSKGAAAVGLREGEMKPVFKAMQTAYIKLLQNPFYDPDEHTPPTGRSGKMITSKKFASDIRRIGEAWAPGVTNL